MKYLKIKTLSLFAITVLILQSCTTNTVKITNGKLTIEINQNLKTKINHSIANVDPINTKFVYSEFLIGKNNEFYNFKKSSYNKSKNIDSVGKYTLHTIIGNYSLEGYNLTKVLNIKIYDTIADFAVFNVNYINNGTKIIEPEKWVNNYGTITPTVGDTILWSFQGESTDSRADWILPVTKGFFQKNYMGMNNSDYGGGIPVVDLWNRNIGIAKGHLELSPKLVSTPVRQKLYSNSAESWIEYNIPEDIMLEKGDTLKTFETFIDIHKGDCFIPLQTFSHVTRLKGLNFVKSEETAFEPIWCAWGYERDFTIKEVLGTLPKVKELGFKWVVLDDGFQQAEGDWKLNRHKFPNGDTDMINFVNTIHKYGLKAKLWYAPLAADPESKLYKNNKDMILLDKGEVPRYISWWDSYYLSPSSKKTIEHTKEVLHMFLDKWGYDGLKLDGQHMNAIPPDYSSDTPIKASEELPEYFKMLYEEAVKIKPNAVVENCPCGDCMSYYNMAYTNQYVSSDPESAWQVRLKGKVYRALVPEMAYYGDHVELFGGEKGWPTSFGIGAVPGTKFTWPKDNPTQSESFLLTPEKEKIWKKWIDLYYNKMLSKANYRGELYDIGFDKPETHAIAKGDTVFYAFYEKDWSGDIELRGLKKQGKYTIYDYVNEKKIGSISANNPVIDIKFTDNLLIEVYPE